VFLDSSGFLALVNRRDAYHQAASRAWTSLIVRDGWQTFTNHFVLAEAHALFLTRLGYAPAVTFLREMERSATAVLPVLPADESAARQLMYRYTDKRFSLTDATSFVLMERNGISVALTSDRNFAQYGFQMLGADL
jgi:uncharacterized protein